MLLRKHIDGYFLKSITQINTERIMEFVFENKENQKKLIFEFLGKGNALLCNEEGLIINALTHHEFKDRTIKPRVKYKFPELKYNYKTMGAEELKDALQNSRRESLVKSLAVVLGFGGVYSEEVCTLSKVDKNKNPKEIDDKEIEKLLKATVKVLDKKIEAKIVLEEGEITDATPFKLKHYESLENKKYESFSAALKYYFTHFKPKIKTAYDKKIESMERILAEQKEHLEVLKVQEVENREKGELFYTKYQEIDAILKDINSALKKYSWKEIKVKLKGHKIVKEVNEKDKKIVIDV